MKKSFFLFSLVLSLVICLLVQYYMDAYIDSAAVWKRVLKRPPALEEFHSFDQEVRFVLFVRSRRESPRRNWIRETWANDPGPWTGYFLSGDLPTQFLLDLQTKYPLGSMQPRVYLLHNDSKYVNISFLLNDVQSTVNGPCAQDSHGWGFTLEESLRGNGQGVCLTNTSLVRSITRWVDMKEVPPSARKPTKWLVFTSAGDDSNHKQWLDGRLFDLWIVY